jgi:S1-C subfamily serine protease
MKQVLAAGAIVLGAWAWAWAPGAEAAGADPALAVVKLYVTAIGRNVGSPWRPGWSYGATGSGAVIAGGRILTAAHVVDDQTFVQVRRSGTARKAKARVLFVSHVADLALLAVDEPGFLDGVVPLEIGELPRVRDAVAAYGFPNGGETLSITEGVVARAEHWTYVHSGQGLLAVQMDAAIAPGSSGGPVVGDGRIVGVAMQGFKDSTIGSAVPAPLVRQFLDDVADGRLDGVPELGLGWQSLENPALRASLRVPAGETGVLLSRVSRSPAGGVLRAGDVLLGLDGRRIADDGTVELRAAERADFRHVVDLRQIGTRVGVRYLRDGVVREGEIVLGRARGEGDLVPRVFDRGADYYLFGGLAFVALTRNVLDWAREWAPPRVAAAAGAEPRAPGEEVVILADILASELNSGYEAQCWEIVDAVDGEPVFDLAGLVRRVEREDGAAHVVFSLRGGSRVTIDRARAVASAAELLARYEIAADRSPRLRALGARGQSPLVADASGGPR